MPTPKPQPQYDPLFAADLARFGPAATYPVPTVAEAASYCKQLAGRHYENFVVVSCMLPRRLRGPFYAVYAYCRWADDLADEIADPAECLRLLDWWEEELSACFRGEAKHPVFVALRDTLREFPLDVQPFRDLLSAFRQDQRKTRYETWAELEDYCTRSAVPVGRIVLQLAGCTDPQVLAGSDHICIGLQYANFLQDVGIDYTRGRIYLPQEELRLWRVREDDLAALLPRTYFGSLEGCLVASAVRTQREFDQGERLLRLATVPPPEWLRIDLELFLEGGRAVLSRLSRIGYDLRKGPKVSKATQLRLFLKAWCRHTWNGVWSRLRGRPV